MDNKLKNNEGIFEKLYNICTKLINGLGIIIIFGMLLLNLIIMGYIKNIHEKVDYRLNYLSVFLIVILITVVLYILVKKDKIKLKYFLIISMLVQIVLGVIWINISKTPVFSDQLLVHKIGKELIENGKLSEEVLIYIMTCPHQLGIRSIFGIIYKIIGIADPIVIRYINVFSIAIITFMLYKITNIIYKDERRNKIVILFSLLFIQFPLLSTFVYGDIIGLMFVLIAVYQTLCVIKKEKNKILHSVFAGISMGFAILVRTNYSIFLIATIIYLVFNIIKEIIKTKYDKENIDNIKSNIIKIIFGIIIICILSISPMNIIKKYMESKYPDDIVSNRSHPLVSYLLMGARTKIDYASHGWWSAEIIELWNKYIGENKAKTKEELRTYLETVKKDGSGFEKLKKEQWKEYVELIKNYIKKPNTMFDFYSEKILSMWTETTFQSIWTNDVMFRMKIYDANVLGRTAKELYFGNTREVYQEYCKALIILIYFGAFIEILNNRKIIKDGEEKYNVDNRFVNMEKLYLAIIFLGGFAFHILWEAKSRYIIPYVIILFPLATGLIDVIINNKIVNKIKLLNPYIKEKEDKRNNN